jgi:hypothetical protein
MMGNEGYPGVDQSLPGKNARKIKGGFHMTENICLMLQSSDMNDDLMLSRALEQVAAAVDLHKRTVLYLGGRWVALAKAGVLERRAHDHKVRYKNTWDFFLHFQNAGGQLLVSASDAQRYWSLKGLDKAVLIQGAIVVDDKTLLTFLTQGTVVLTF